MRQQDIFPRLHTPFVASDAGRYASLLHPSFSMASSLPGTKSGVFFPPKATSSSYASPFPPSSTPPPIPSPPLSRPFATRWSTPPPSSFSLYTDVESGMVARGAPLGRRPLTPADPSTTREEWDTLNETMQQVVRQNHWLHHAVQVLEARWEEREKAPRERPKERRREAEGNHRPIPAAGGMDAAQLPSENEIEIEEEERQQKRPAPRSREASGRSGVGGERRRSPPLYSPPVSSLHVVSPFDAGEGYGDRPPVFPPSSSLLWHSPPPPPAIGSAAPPAPLSEVDQLRRRVHELQDILRQEHDGWCRYHAEQEKHLATIVHQKVETEIVRVQHIARDAAKQCLADTLPREFRVWQETHETLAMKQEERLTQQFRLLLQNEVADVRGMCEAAAEGDGRTMALGPFGWGSAIASPSPPHFSASSSVSTSATVAAGCPPSPSFLAAPPPPAAWLEVVDQRVESPLRKLHTTLTRESETVLQRWRVENDERERRVRREVLESIREAQRKQKEEMEDEWGLGRWRGEVRRWVDEAAVKSVRQAMADRHMATPFESAEDWPRGGSSSCGVGVSLAQVVKKQEEEKQKVEALVDGLAVLQQQQVWPLRQRQEGLEETVRQLSSVVRTSQAQVEEMAIHVTHDFPSQFRRIEIRLGMEDGAAAGGGDGGGQREKKKHHHHHPLVCRARKVENGVRTAHERTAAGVYE